MVEGVQQGPVLVVLVGTFFSMWCTVAGTVKWRYLWAPQLSPIGSM